jgi:hypothetical protein
MFKFFFDRITSLIEICILDVGMLLIIGRRKGVVVGGQKP